MIKQLLLCKRLMVEGAAFAGRSDPVSSGMAISFFQDSVEMCIWALIKEKSITVKDGSSFTANIETLTKTGITLPHTAKLLELNKARVGFKHYGNLPAVDEAVKFQSYVEDFLRESFKNHFSRDFDQTSLVDLVSFPEVREQLKKAEVLLIENDFNASAIQAGIAKKLLFNRLDSYIPHVDRNLRRLDDVLNNKAETRGLRTFQYLTEYLDTLRETSLASLLRLPLQDYNFLRRQIPNPSQYANGSWSTNINRNYDAATCEKAISCLVDMSIKLEGLV
jgi:hypothetical protein